MEDMEEKNKVKRGNEEAEGRIGAAEEEGGRKETEEEKKEL